MRHIKLFEDFVNEGSKYLVNIEYRVDKNWYHDPLEVLKTDLHFNELIDSYEIKSTEYDGDDFVAIIKLISKVDKRKTIQYFDEHSTRIEKYTII